MRTLERGVMPHTPTADSTAARLWRAVPIPLTLVLGVFAVLVAMTFAVKLDPAVDITQYLNATRRWLDTGTPYLPQEVAAPFQFGVETFLHPPISLLLFAPFLVLPLALWWAIPIGAVLWSIWSWRPVRWAFPAMAALMIWPRSTGILFVGNTDMWVCAFVALGLRYGWPALLIAVKPSFVPLMLVGIRHRSWWWGVPVLALLCLPFGNLWFEWLAVIRNAPATITYSIANLPLMFVPIVAWLGRTRLREPAADRVSSPRDVIASFRDLGAALRSPFRRRSVESQRG